MIDFIPLFKPERLLYIWLLAITWPFLAIKLKNTRPSLATFLSKFFMSAACLFTDLIPFVHPRLSA